MAKLSRQQKNRGNATAEWEVDKGESGAGGSACKTLQLHVQRAISVKQSRVATMGRLPRVAADEICMLS